MGDYYLNHYGKCRLLKCNCIVTSWKGITCDNFQSFGAKNHIELGIAQEKIKK